MWWGPKGGASKGGGPKPRKVGLPRVGPRGGPKKGWAPNEGWGAQNFALFFSLSRHNFLSFFSLLGVFSWNFGGFFCSAGALKCARLEFSGCRVRAPAARSGGAAGVSHDSPRTPNVHISGHLLFKTPPKFNEKTPRETQKQRNGGGKGKKKSEILGGPAEGGPVEGGPAEGGPGKSKPATTVTTTTTTTPNPEQVGPRPLPSKV